MLKKLRFPNKLLSLELNDDYLLIGDNKGFVYKYMNNNLSKLFFCDSPISSIKINNSDIFYTTWDGDIYKNTYRVNLETGIIKSMIILDNLIYVSLGLKIYILSLDLEVVKVLEVPHKVLCFDVVDKYVVCGLNLPILAFIDRDFNLIIEDICHDTAILSVKCIGPKILTGSVDGSVQEYDIGDLSNQSYLKSTLINDKSEKWVRDICDSTLFTRGREVYCNGSKIIDHDDEVMRVCKWNNKIISIGLDCVMNIYEEETILDEELDEISKLNALYQ